MSEPHKREVRVVKYWLSTAPEVCDWCGNKLYSLFVDGRVFGGTSWAIMCVTCHHTKGYGFGTGQGQLYDLESLEKLKG